MYELIKNMMMWFNISEKDLYKKKELGTPIGETLYYTYYKYVKDNQINTWNNETYILYGIKDNLVSSKSIDEFKDRFKVNVTYSEDSEHYFHTEEDMNIYRNWLRKSLSNKRK